MKSLVIIPTYNEIDNIGNLLQLVPDLYPGLEVLIIDDGSPDGTAGVVKEYQTKDSRIHLIERKGKLGLGSAYVRGFKFAIDNGYDFILEMDADFSHNPHDIPRLIDTAQKYDLVIGSRYSNGVNIVNWPIKRLLISYFASKYVRLITGMPVKDPTGGFKCFKRRTLEAIDLDQIHSNGYSFQVEMNYRAWCKGFTIKEIPIIFTERVNGVSKMSPSIVREAAWMIWYLRALRIFRRL